MGDRKRSEKFVTSILIGGALGSIAALLFGRRKRKSGDIKERVRSVLESGSEPKKKGIFGRWK